MNACARANYLLWPGRTVRDDTTLRLGVEKMALLRSLTR